MTRHSITTADGLTLAVHQWGEAGAAAPVVLHHGFGVSAQSNWVFPGDHRSAVGEKAFAEAILAFLA